MLLKNLPPLSRRDFLKTTSLTGLATTMPAWLLGCGADDSPDNPPPTVGRELRDLHFDFSNRPEVTDIRLMALLSDADDRRLKLHSNQTRDQFRLENPLLAEVPDQKLTHYVEDVELPNNALQTIMSFGTQVETGDTVLCSTCIHIPKVSLRAFATRALAAGAEPLNQSLFRNYQARHENSVKALTEALADINDFSDWDDIAAFLVFHHPEIMNLDADLGCEILQRIYSLPCGQGDTICFPYLTELSEELEDLGCASTTPGGWATLVPQMQLVFDDNGDLIPEGDAYREDSLLDEDGQPVYDFEPHEDLKEPLRFVVQEVLKEVFDDEGLAGHNWHAPEGMSTLHQQAANEMAKAADSGFKVQADSPQGTVLHGIEIADLEVKDQQAREVEVQLINWHLRFVNVHVEYFQDDTQQKFKRKPLANLPYLRTEQDTERAQFLRTLPTNSLAGAVSQFVGPDFLKPSPYAVSFTMPLEATGARLYFGSLGVGGNPFCPEAVSASVFTLIFNLGLPTLFLALGIGTGIAEIFNIVRDASQEALNAVSTLSTAILVSKTSAKLSKEGIFIAGQADSLAEFLHEMINEVVKVFIAIIAKKVAGEIGAQLLKKIAVAISKNVTASAASSAFPVAKLALFVLSTTAALVPIAVTVGEVLANPAIFHNDIKLTLDTQLSLTPQDATFATAASGYSITAKYSSGLPRIVEDTLQGGSAGPIQVTLAGVPSGGEVSFDVCLFSAEGCIVGIGSFGPVPNFPDTVSTVNIEIEQRALPLTANTQYQHAYKLAMSNGQRVWQAASTAPSTTQASLSASGLSALNNITVQTRSANIGYSFQAAAQGISPCDGGAGGLLHSFQNISSATDGAGDQGLQFSDCGWRQPAALVYDPQGTTKEPGRNFFIRPLEGHFHVLSIVPGQGAVNTRQTVSWGRFSLAPTSLALHPQGFIVGVSREFHKMEILQLSEQAVSLSEAPEAVPFAVMKAGLGGRSGLLDTPVAVTVHQGTVLVLERGSQLKGYRRIQAFDVSANPVNQFGDSNILPLPEDGSEYLDIGVDGLGYIFVLNIINGGRSQEDYRLDVYDPAGHFVTRTTGMVAGRMAVSLFRSVHTLNFETLIGSPRTEPTLSQWIPFTPGGCR